MNSGVRFLEEWAREDRNKPFFLTVSATPPHFPHYLPKEHAEFADQKSRLRGQLMAWLRDIGDPLPDRAPSLPEAGTIVATGKPGP